MKRSFVRAVRLASAKRFRVVQLHQRQLFLIENLFNLWNTHFNVYVKIVLFEYRISSDRLVGGYLQNRVNGYLNGGGISLIQFPSLTRTRIDFSQKLRLLIPQTMGNWLFYVIYWKKLPII